MARPPRWVEAARGQWRFTGQERPPFAVEPGPGQRSVWDFPRPPVIEPVPEEVTVRLGDTLLARTTRCLRVLETASPPTYYLPPEDVQRELLQAAPERSHCEWKGLAHYWDLVHDGETLRGVAWSYPEPFPEFAALADHLAFYPTVLDCRVGDARVTPQPGGFYGGWITPDLVGPFKGEPGVPAL